MNAACEHCKLLGDDLDEAWATCETDSINYVQPVKLKLLLAIRRFNPRPEVADEARFAVLNCLLKLQSLFQSFLNMTGTY